MEKNFTDLLKSERGEFGIKQIAITVAIIVLIGLLVTVIDTNLGTWVGEVWDMLIDKIQDLIGN